MSKGRYGEYGGQYISETLMHELLYLEEQYNEHSQALLQNSPLLDTPKNRRKDIPLRA